MRILTLIVLASAVVCASAQEGARARFGVDVDGVRVDVQVTRRGRPVAGLRAGDFELRDNGVVQRIESVTREDIPLDLFLVLDASASVAGEPRRALSEAARVAVAALGTADRVSLLTFTHRLSEPARLSNDRRAVLAAIDSMGASGATSLFDAVYAALVLREDSRQRALVIAFTDGHDSSSWLAPSAVLEVAKQTDAVVYGVTLAPPEPVPSDTVARSGPELVAGQLIVTRSAGRQEPSPFLAEVASMTGGRVLHASNPAKTARTVRAGGPRDEDQVRPQLHAPGCCAGRMAYPRREAGGTRRGRHCSSRVLRAGALASFRLKTEATR